MLRNTPDTVEVIGEPTVVDVDGVPEYTYTPSYFTQGIFSVLDVEEQVLWTGQKVTASVRVNLGIDPIAPGNRVVVGGHHYEVVTTRSSPICLRAMLRRSE